jgi:threonine-phosphate decarboxylase
LNLTEGFFEHGGELEKIEKLGVSPEDLLDFSVNLNPLGPPEKLFRTLKEHIYEVTRYPEPHSESLSLKLSRKLGVPRECVLISNGSNQLIYAVCCALKPQKALIVQPTFSEYERAAILHGTHVTDLILNHEDGFSIPTEELIGNLKSSDIAFICNPNNPTGHIWSRELLLDLMRELPDVIFVVDEAFSDFSDEPISLLEEAPKLKNLVVLRSFTKLFSIPGLRLGYAVSNGRTASILKSYIEPWSVNRLAQIAGEILLDLDRFVEESRELIFTERELLFLGLRSIEGLTPFRSHANFLLIRCDKLRSYQLQAKLLKLGIFIRDCSNFKGLDERFIRVAVRGRDENERLLSALEEVLGPNRMSARALWPRRYAG